MAKPTKFHTRWVNPLFMICCFVIKTALCLVGWIHRYCLRLTLHLRMVDLKTYKLEESTQISKLIFCFYCVALLCMLKYSSWANEHQTNICDLNRIQNNDTSMQDAAIAEEYNGIKYEWMKNESEQTERVNVDFIPGSNLSFSFSGTGIIHFCISQWYFFYEMGIWW